MLLRLFLLGRRRRLCSPICRLGENGIFFRSQKQSACRDQKNFRWQTSLRHLQGNLEAPSKLATAERAFGERQNQTDSTGHSKQRISATRALADVFSNRATPDQRSSFCTLRTPSATELNRSLDLIRLISLFSHRETLWRQNRFSFFYSWP